MSIQDIQLLIEKQTSLIEEQTKKLQDLKIEAVNIISNEAFNKNQPFPLKVLMQISFHETKNAFSNWISKKTLVSEDVNSELMDFLIRAYFKTEQDVIQNIEKSFNSFTEREKLFFATYTNQSSQAFYRFDFIDSYLNNYGIYTKGKNFSYTNSLFRASGIDMDNNVISLTINDYNIYENIDTIVDTLISMFNLGYKPKFLRYSYQFDIEFKIDYDNQTFYKSSQSVFEDDVKLKINGLTFKEKLKSAILILNEIAEDKKDDEDEEDYE